MLCAEASLTSWVEPVLDQEDCGSCYAVAGVHMLSSRWKVHTKRNDAEGFSINFPLYCSDFNQGCNGGFPSLVSLWSKQVGVVPKRCTGAYYTSSSDQCREMVGKLGKKDEVTALIEKKSSAAGHKNSLHLTRAERLDAKYEAGMQEFEKCLSEEESKSATGSLARVSGWSYVGGYYGNSNAAKMMQDVFNFGALAVALEPESDFMYYSKGIYRHTSAKTNVPWVRVDHAVLLIGWGEAEEEVPAGNTKGALIQMSDSHSKKHKQTQMTKYWTVQNSWGTEWGESGTIRIIRGENESGIEFQAVAAYFGEGDCDNCDGNKEWTAAEKNTDARGTKEHILDYVRGVQQMEK